MTFILRMVRKLSKQIATQTPTQSYPSKYSPDKFITEAQYIAEMICERRAESLNKRLTVQFWKHPEWASYYKFQMMSINKLIPKYTGRVILQVLKRNKRIYSLNAKWVETKIAEEYNKVSLESITAEKPVEQEQITNPVVGRSPLQDNSRKKLMDLDKE